jgi:hypothetical protein
MPRIAPACSGGKPSHSTRTTASLWPRESSARSWRTSSRASTPTRGSGGVCGQPVLRVGREPPEPAAIQVQRGPVQIAGWRIHQAHLVPPLEHPDQRVLRQLVGLQRVSRDEEQRLGKAPVLALEELPEIGPRSALAQRRRLHVEVIPIHERLSFTVRVRTRGLRVRTIRSPAPRPPARAGTPTA